MIFSKFSKVGVSLLLPLLFFNVSCQKKEADQAAAKPLSALEQKGKGTYLSICIACHNPDPRLDGSVGPAIAGSSLELVTARVLTRSYPPGYKPKRSSEMMPDFPQLKDDIPGLHAYLNSFKQ
jgi:mono/diheme cytochrome c family protein